MKRNHHLIAVAALSHQLAELYDAALQSPDGSTHGNT